MHENGLTGNELADGKDYELCLPAAGKDYDTLSCEA